MLQTDRFVRREAQQHLFLQPESPVYVHCTRQSQDRRSGARFLQLRMVSCGEKTVETVVFDLEGLDVNGEPVCVLRGLMMTECKAEAGKIFGENRVFALPRQNFHSLRVTVRQVTFADGMSWKMLPRHAITTVAEAGWKLCHCGMPNPPERGFCRFCGERLSFEDMEITLPIELPPETFQRPAPIVRREMPTPVPEQEIWYEEPEVDEEEDEGVPVWLSVLLCVFGSLAILALLAFGAFFLWQYIL